MGRARGKTLSISVDWGSKPEGVVNSGKDGRQNVNACKISTGLVHACTWEGDNRHEENIVITMGAGRSRCMCECMCVCVLEFELSVKGSTRKYDEKCDG